MKIPSFILNDSLFNCHFSKIFCRLLLGIIIFSAIKANAQNKDYPPMAVGFSYPLSNINDSSMQAIKAAGVDCIEIAGISNLVDQQTNLKFSREALSAMALKAKMATDKAGVKIWSIHMGFGKHIDLSELDHQKHAKTIAFHQEVLNMCRILQPTIILFHPSWYLGLHEREARTRALIESCKELLPQIQQLGATMVIENMLGFELQKDSLYERPLCRSVQETEAIFARLPKAVGSAIDMNHIKNPEKLILAMGRRLKTVHIADGNGHEENHYLPCNGKGQNNWNAILDALYAVDYKGPFLFECHYKDFSQFRTCYQELYQKFLASKK